MVTSGTNLCFLLERRRWWKTLHLNRFCRKVVCASSQDFHNVALVVQKSTDRDYTVFWVLMQFHRLAFRVGLWGEKVRHDNIFARTLRGRNMATARRNTGTTPCMKSYVIKRTQKLLFVSLFMAIFLSSAAVARSTTNSGKPKTSLKFFAASLLPDQCCLFNWEIARKFPRRDDHYNPCYDTCTLNRYRHKANILHEYIPYSIERLTTSSTTLGPDIRFQKAGGSQPVAF